MQGLFTTLLTSNTFHPTAGYNSGGYLARTSFGKEDTPVAVAMGYDDVTMTLEVKDMSSGKNLLTREIFIARGQSVLQPIFILQSGEFKVCLLQNGAEKESYRFTVQREPMTTSEGKKNYDLVIFQINAYMKINSSNPLAFKTRGSAYAAKGAWDDAIKDFSEAIRLVPYDVNSFALRATAYSKKKQWPEALDDFVECTRLAPENPTGWLERAMVRLKLGEYDKAISDLRESLKTHPDFQRCENELAWILATCPQPDLRNGREAVELASKACQETSWKIPMYIDTLAAAYGELGEFEMAVKYEKQALQDPSVVGKTRENDQNRLSLYVNHQPYRMPPNNGD